MPQMTSSCMLTQPHPSDAAGNCNRTAAPRQQPAETYRGGITHCASPAASSGLASTAHVANCLLAQLLLRCGETPELHMASSAQPAPCACPTDRQHAAQLPTSQRAHDSTASAAAEGSITEEPLAAAALAAAGSSHTACFRCSVVSPAASSTCEALVPSSAPRITLMMTVQAKDTPATAQTARGGQMATGAGACRVDE